MVAAMLDLVKGESERIDSRFLEPACGSGNFLIPVLQRKLATVETRYGSNVFEKQHHALLALMAIYGIELLEDNTLECRDSLVATFIDYCKVSTDQPLVAAARAVVMTNIVNGDALTMMDASGQPIIFPEWAYLGKGRFQRRDFRFDALTQMSLFGEGTLFESMDTHEIFTPAKDYPALSIVDIARMAVREPTEAERLDTDG